MQPFSVDFLTGNTTGQSYSGHGYEPESEQHEDDSRKPVEPTYHNSVNLDDVFSIISKDAAGMTTSLDISRSSQSPVDLSRGTPSPNRDSGIDSDMSPGFSLSNESIAETLSKLDQTAEAVKSKPSAKSDDKPGTSYLAMIAQAILSSPCRKLTLGDIYRHVMDTHPFYNNSEKSWRGSIRYTLSINECFVKDGKDESGKGNYWAIHPNCVKDFEKGDYRRRQARRRAKKNVKSVSSYEIAQPAALMTSRASAAYTPMTSPYMYNQYFPAQAAYGYNPQTAYNQEMSKENNPPGGANIYPSIGNTVQPHPAFGYGNYPVGYGYMYPDYYAMESAYRRQFDAKKTQQYTQSQVDMKKHYSGIDTVSHNEQKPKHEPESYTNVIQIV